MDTPSIEIRLGLLDDPADPSLLSPEERTAYNRFAPLERKKQYLIGRKLVKEWVQKFQPGDWVDFSLHPPETDSKPRLHYRGKVLSDCDVSLSHKGKWIVMAASRGCRVGIDIEKPILSKVNMEKFLDHFCTSQEKKRLLQYRESSEKIFEEKTTLYWTLKEAALKTTGTGFRLSPNKLALDEEKRTITFPDGRILHWKTWPDPEKTVSLVTNLDFNRVSVHFS